MPMPLMDMSGRRFGLLTVIDRAPNTTGDARWNCICDCGAATVSWGANLRSGNTTSCGCVKVSDRPGRQINLTGQRFGKLVAVVVVPRVGRGNRRWTCQCDCGSTKVVRADRLSRGETVSCGCHIDPKQPLRPMRVRAETSAKDHVRRSAIRGAGGKFTAHQIVEMLIEQGFACKTCPTPIDHGTFHRDHIKAISRGGTNDISNIQLLCVPCNRRKYTKDNDEFINGLRLAS